jgi:SAM-dependent methyltransferase
MAAHSASYSCRHDPGKKEGRLGNPLRRWLAHPLTAGRDLDDPATTELRREIVASKPFLRAIYNEWYAMLAANLPPVDGAVLELGSGAGYVERFIPGAITSEIQFCSGLKLVADGQQLPFGDSSLRAIVFTDVLHHMPDVRRFFEETRRCLKPGGRILMIEPWVSGWSSFVYRKFHHEPFRPDSAEWPFPSSGPLSGANGALPWIVFERDRAKFEAEFPELAVEKVQPFMPFRYLLSGGVGMRSLVPGFTYPFWKGLEGSMNGLMPQVAMFVFVSVRRR